MWFSNSLEGVPTYGEHLLTAFPSLCGPAHPSASHLGLGQVIVAVGSSDELVGLALTSQI